MAATVTPATQIPAGTWTGSTADVQRMIQRVRRIAPGLGAAAADLTAEDIVTNEFIDPSITMADVLGR